ncbi:hypothetical protein EV1_023416 [Malus domestica]
MQTRARQTIVIDRFVCSRPQTSFWFFFITEVFIGWKLKIEQSSSRLLHSGIRRFVVLHPYSTLAGDTVVLQGFSNRIARRVADTSTRCRLSTINGPTLSVVSSWKAG